MSVYIVGDSSPIISSIIWGQNDVKYRKIPYYPITIFPYYPISL